MHLFWSHGSRNIFKNTLYTKINNIFCLVKRQGLSAGLYPTSYQIEWTMQLFRNSYTVSFFLCRVRTAQPRVARLAFLTPNFTNLAFFRGRWRQKKLLGFLAFFLQYLAFFGGSSHMLSDWCLGFLIKILLKSVIIIGFLRQCFVCIFCSNMLPCPLYIIN